MYFDAADAISVTKDDMDTVIVTAGCMSFWKTGVDAC